MLPKAETDSLFLLWHNVSFQDTIRLKAIGRLAWQGYINADPDSARVLAREMFALAKDGEHLKYMGKALNTIAISYYNGGVPDSAVFYLQRCAELAETAGNAEGKANTLSNVGVILSDQGKQQEALEAYTEALSIRTELKDSFGIAVSIGNIAIIYQEQGKHEMALALHGDALRIYERLSHELGMAAAMNNLGILNLKLGLEQEALEWHLKALEIERGAQDKIGMARSLSNIGNVFVETDRADEAIPYYTEALQLSEQIGDKLGTAIRLENIGTAFSKQGDTVQALHHYQRSLSISEELGDLIGMSSCSKNIGHIILAQGHVSEAIVLATDALRHARDAGELKEEMHAAELLYRCHKAAGKTLMALEAFELYIELKDSVDKESSRKAAMRQRFQYEYENKQVVLKAEQDAKDSITEALIRGQRIAIMGMAGGGALLLGLGVSGFMLYRQRERNAALAQVIAARDSERNRLSRELHDGVAGELLGLQRAAENGKATGMSLQLARLRDDVRNISHDLAMPDIRHTSLPEMIDYLVGRWRHMGREVVLFTDPQDDAQWRLPPDKALHLYRIAQEGLTNAMYHAAEDAQITVRLCYSQAGIDLSVTNPMRMEVPRAEGNGIGIRNVQERATLIGGEALFVLENGVASLKVHVRV